VSQTEVAESFLNEFHNYILYCQVAYKREITWMCERFSYANYMASIRIGTLSFGHFEPQNLCGLY
jgi:hypothetical protein